MCLAVPGRILDITGTDPLLRSGTVDFAGTRKTVSLACVPEARVGDYVLVHVGIAIETVDEAEANQVFDYLRQMGDLAELENDAPATGTALTSEEKPLGGATEVSARTANLRRDPNAPGDDTRRK